MDQFTLENLTVGRGQKVQGYLDLPFTEKDKLPVTLIYGREEGPTVLLEGGLHNAEYVGIHTVIGLSRELEPEDIHGILIIINILNVNGFKARTVSVSAADGKNLNRVFPGDPEGTYSDRLADFMVKKIFPRIDYFIDVHNGDWFEDLSPFIYAVGKAEDISSDESGAVTFPAQTLYITNLNGDEIRQYSKKGRYVTDTKVSGSVLEMSFVRKKGNSFEKTDDKDYIRYKEEKSNTVSIASRQSETFGEQLYFSFPDYVYIQIAPDLLLTKFKTNENNLTMELKRKEEEDEQYYVYADGENKLTSSNLPDAVKKASELRGNVIDSNERMIWQCAFDEYDIVPGMDQVIKVSSDRLSLAGCLSMVASLNGKKISPDEIDRKPGLPAALLEMCTGVKTLTLTGCALDDVLYYVNQGSPVLARYSDTRYVLVMSYNSTKIRYLDPVTGKSTVEDRAQITESFKKQGNIFYSYLTD